MKESAVSIDNDKSPEMKKIKADIGINSLPLAFNIISSSEVSQDKSTDR